jgi:hypothetical protein
MKKIVLGFVILFFFQSFAQNPEFAKSSNGLIYSDNTIKQLKYIVDSLNIRFRACDLHKVYRAKAQGKANFIKLDTGDIKAALRDIEANISFDEFVKKYPAAKSDPELFVVRFDYKDHEDKDVTRFSSVELSNDHYYIISLKENVQRFLKPLKGTWVFDYWPGSKLVEEQISAFYFTANFIEPSLPEKYARMVQYSDCMVDTTVGIFKENAQRTGVRSGRQPKEKSKVNDFFHYINSKTGRPDYFSGKWSEAKSKEYLKKYNEWDSLRLGKTDRLKESDAEFNELFEAALLEALADGSASNNAFEEYVNRYKSPKIALELKRSRIVVGGCSQDMSPRVHAMNIALLSAETINWEIFLRSHLDIMNDNFERNSDGSYAWAERKTYIKELEVLDFNVTDLLLGISLRIENPGEHHYYGNISRLGRALSESQYQATIENKILDMIRDEKLDNYNRMLMYYLYLNYNYYIDNKELQKKNIEKLQSAVNTLPVYLASKIKLKED